MRLPSITLSVLCLAVGCGHTAPPPEADQIAFVELRLTEAGAEVVSVETVPGRLKARRSGGPPVTPGLLGVEVFADDGLVWQDAVEDPLVRRVEFVNEAGDLETRWERAGEGTVSLRFPAVAARQEVALFREAETGRVSVARVEVAL